MTAPQIAAVERAYSDLLGLADALRLCSMGLTVANVSDRDANAIEVLGNFATAIADRLEGALMQ